MGELRAHVRIHPTFMGLFIGDNFGKMMVEVGD
jgi:NADPH-dependent curcumin reductase CurA